MTPEQLIGIVKARIAHAESISRPQTTQPVTLNQNIAVALVDHYKTLREWGRAQGQMLAQLKQHIEAHAFHLATDAKPDIDRLVIVEWAQDQIGTRIPGALPRMELMMMGQFMLDSWEDRSNWIKRWCYCPMPPTDA